MLFSGYVLTGWPFRFRIGQLVISLGYGVYGLCLVSGYLALGVGKGSHCSLSLLLEVVVLCYPYKLGLGLGCRFFRVKKVSHVRTSESRQELTLWSESLG